MIVKLLGILDLLAALFFWLFGMFGVIHPGLITIFAFYLLIKGVVFLISADIASILDIVSAGIMFIALGSGVPKILTILVALYLIQKGLFSLAA